MHSESAPCKTCAMAPSIDPSQWTYTDYACFLRAHGFHNLGLLDEYLQWGLKARQSPQVRQPEASRTTLLEFGTAGTRVADLSDPAKLRLLLREWTRPALETTTSSKGPTGRIVMIENISPRLIDTLGGLLNIDPTFFASHLDDPTFTQDASSLQPLSSTATRSQKDFFTLEYITAFTPLGCGREVEGLPLQCKGNYSRRIELIQKQGKQRVALARRKISFCLKTGDPWLCIVLVDPPLSTFSIGFSDFTTNVPSQSFEVIPYSGGYLDFIEMRKPHSRQHHDFRDCRYHGQNPSTFDDLIRHWQIQARDGLFNNTTSSSLSTFMRPAFQIAASETTNFFTYLRTTLETTTTNNPTNTRRQLDKLIFIDTLLSRFKPILTLAKDYLTPSPTLKEDYRSLLLDLHHHRATCDSQLQHLTSLIQHHETTQIASLNTEAIRRADYMRYLTIIALLYAPFALACAIFTMPHDFAPAAHYLYKFLPVTAVVTLLFVLLVLPESRDGMRIERFKARFCGGVRKDKLLKDNTHRPRSRGSGGSGIGGKEVYEV